MTVALVPGNSPPAFISEKCICSYLLIREAPTTVDNLPKQKTKVRYVQAKVLCILYEMETRCFETGAWCFFCSSASSGRTLRGPFGVFYFSTS